MATSTAQQQILDSLGSDLMKEIGGKPFALYFSAHWCPPCRGFTPKLAEWYKAGLKDKMEIIFVSSDRDEDAFNEYFAEMPWKSLPWKNRKEKEALSKACKCRGIPHLAVFNADGSLVTQDGREQVTGDPTGETFPEGWKPPGKKQILDSLGSDLMKEIGGKPFALYFSAHWCPPCRGFTPKLAEWYNAGLKDKMEIIFVSSDREEAAFNEYFAEMPWKSLPFKKRKEKELLSKACNCEGIPHLAVFNADGSLMTEDGRAAVTRDPKGETFPEGWKPQPFCDVADGVDALNNEKCLVYLGMGVDTDSCAPLKEVASEYHLKAGGEISEMAYRFFAATDSGITDQIRKLTGVTGKQLIMLDIDDDGAFYIHEGDVTVDAVKAFISKFESKSLERKQLQK